MEVEVEVEVLCAALRHQLECLLTQSAWPAGPAGGGWEGVGTGAVWGWWGVQSGNAWLRKDVL